MKKCNKCKINKNLILFYKDSKSKDGYRTVCKECEKERHSKFAKQRWKQISSDKTLHYWNSRANKLKQKAQGTITGKDLQHLVLQTKGICSYCNLQTNNFVFDHIISIFNGGSSDIENIQILCTSCNKIKGKMNHDDFINLIQKIVNNTNIGQYRANPIWTV